MRDLCFLALSLSPSLRLCSNATSLSLSLQIVNPVLLSATKILSREGEGAALGSLLIETSLSASWCATQQSCTLFFFLSTGIPPARHSLQNHLSSRLTRERTPLCATSAHLCECVSVSMQGPLLRSPQSKSYRATSNTTASTAFFAMTAELNTQQHPRSGGAAAAADPTSIIVVDDASQEKSFIDFFTFDSPGGLTWWAAAILGLLGCCSLASMIIIQVATSRREPPAVMALMGSQQCPFLSSLLPPLAFEAWHASCPRVSRGKSFTCSTASDCVALGSLCADPRVLAQLQCVHTGTEAKGKKKVCAYPSMNSTASQPSLASPGFCTAAGTTCAVCLSGSCGPTAPSVGSIGCPSTSACASGSWMCNPFAA